MKEDIQDFNAKQTDEEQAVCDMLCNTIDKNLPQAESKIWHRHPVWFLDGNPTVGYAKLKDGIRLMFWSGQSFEEEALQPSKSGKFKDASITYTTVDQINVKDVKRWLKKYREIQWDYKNLVKRKGVLERLK